MRVLALDIGTKKTGIAISDLNQTVISPLHKLCISGFRGNLFFESLKKHIFCYWKEIDTVVIGNGLDLEYDNSVVKYIDQVQRMLNSWTTWKVITLWETNTSVDSRDFLKKIGFSRTKIRELIDSYAALLLLKDYFDSINKEVLVSWRS